MASRKNNTVTREDLRKLMAEMRESNPSLRGTPEHAYASVPQQPPPELPPIVPEPPTIERIYNAKGVEFYNLTAKKSRLSLGYWVDKWNLSRHASSTVLIHFELKNGFHRQFLAKEDTKGGFRYKDNMYIFDQSLKYYDIDAALWCYDFHEDFSLPIKRSVPIEELKKYIYTSKVTDIEYATNPKLLEKFVDSKIIEAIMRGAQLDEWMKQMRVLIIITLFVSSLMLILFVWKSGMLSQVKLPGFG
jgi:hypothetical protein